MSENAIKREKVTVTLSFEEERYDCCHCGETIAERTHMEYGMLAKARGVPEGVPQWKLKLKYMKTNSVDMEGLEPLLRTEGKCFQCNQSYLFRYPFWGNEYISYRNPLRSGTYVAGFREINALHPRFVEHQDKLKTVEREKRWKHTGVTIRCECDRQLGHVAERDDLKSRSYRERISLNAFTYICQSLPIADKIDPYFYRLLTLDLNLLPFHRQEFNFDTYGDDRVSDPAFGIEGLVNENLCHVAGSCPRCKVRHDFLARERLEILMLCMESTMKRKKEIRCENMY